MTLRRWIGFKGGLHLIVQLVKEVGGGGGLLKFVFILELTA